MRAFAVDGFGEQGSGRDLPDPTAGEGEVVIGVRAAGVNQTGHRGDRGVHEGLPRAPVPAHPGHRCVRRRRAGWPGRHGVEAGDEVYGFVRRPVMRPGDVRRAGRLAGGGIQGKPTGLRHEEAAIIGHSGLTAIATIQGANLRARQTDRDHRLDRRRGQLRDAAGRPDRRARHGRQPGRSPRLRAIARCDRGRRLRRRTRRCNPCRSSGRHRRARRRRRCSRADGAALTLVKPGGKVVSILFAPDAEALAARHRGPHGDPLGGRGPVRQPVRLDRDGHRPAARDPDIPGSTTSSRR